MFAFAQVGDSQNRVTQGTVPELAAAFGVAQGSGTLVAAGPRLTATANQDELTRAVVEMAPAQRAFERELEDLMRTLADGDAVTVDNVDGSFTLSTPSPPTRTAPEATDDLAPLSEAS